MISLRQRFNLLLESFFIFFIILFMIFPLISFILTSLYGQPLSILEFRLNIIHNITLKYFLYILDDPYYYDSIYHTLELSLAVTIASFLLALPISYGMSFMNIPFKKTIKSLIISGISIPGLITTYALIIIATNFGIFRYQLYSFYGLMAVMTVSSLPFMVIYQTIAFDSIDTRLLEAATVHGLSKLRTFRKIILPLLMPGFATSILIVFLLNTGTLSVPILLAPSNFQVISELAFVQLFSFYNWGIASALLLILLLINLSVILTYMYYIKSKRYTTVTGKAFRPFRNDNKILKVIITVYSILFSLFPLVEIFIIGLTSFSYKWVGTIFPTHFTLNNFYESLGLYPNAIWSTLILSGAAAFIGVTLSMIPTYFSWIYGMKWKKMANVVILLIFSMSPVIIGILLLTMYNNSITGWIINSVPIGVIFGYVVGRMGYSTRALDVTLSSISKTLFEAERLMVRSKFKGLGKITIPLLIPGIVEGFVLVFVRSTIDYGTTIMLVPIQWTTLTLASFAFLTTGELSQGAALAFIIIIINIPIMLLLYSKRNINFRDSALA